MKNGLLTTEALRQMHGQAVYVMELGGGKGKYWDVVQVRPDGRVTLRDHPDLERSSEDCVPWLACLRRPTWEDPLVDTIRSAPAGERRNE